MAMFLPRFFIGPAVDIIIVRTVLLFLIAEKKLLMQGTGPVKSASPEFGLSQPRFLIDLSL